MGKLGLVRFGDTDIEYKVRRSERRKKTVQIIVDEAGVQVLAPADMSDGDLQALIIRRAAWILQHDHQETATQPPKKFISGETLPYLGRNARLIVKMADTPVPVIRFDHWRFHIMLPEGLEGDERYRRIMQAVMNWYRKRAAERIPVMVERWRTRLGHDGKPRILIRDQRQRWGSCAPDGTLRFNWRVIMLEPSLVEYIVVHELAHLSIKSHSKDFWRLVASMLPDVEQRRIRLKEVGNTLPW